MTQNRNANDATRGQDEQSDPTEQQLVVEIEETRREMSGTIDEIGYRLSPQTIAEQARENIREATVGRVERIVEDAGQTAQQTGNTVVQTIKQNPVPAALAAIGIGWLGMRMREQSSSGNAGQRGRHATYGRYRSPSVGYYSAGEAYGATGYGEGQGQAQGRSLGGGAEDVRQRAGQATEQVGQRAQELGDEAQRAAQDIAQRSREGFEQAQWQVQSGVSQAQQQFDRTLHENPLAVGALALGVGVAVGLALPETQQERQMLGEQRDQLLSQVEEKASQALSEAEQKARETGEKVRQQSSS